MDEEIAGVTDDLLYHDRIYVSLSKSRDRSMPGLVRVMLHDWFINTVSSLFDE